MYLALCNKSIECNDHGNCGDDGKCLCHNGYYGKDCSSKLISLRLKLILSVRIVKLDIDVIFYFPLIKVLCDATTTCNGHGSCTNDGDCICDNGFYAANC